MAELIKPPKYRIITADPIIVISSEMIDKAYKKLHSEIDVRKYWEFVNRKERKKTPCVKRTDGPHILSRNNEKTDEALLVVSEALRKHCKTLGIDISERLVSLDDFFVFPASENEFKAKADMRMIFIEECCNHADFLFILLHEQVHSAGINSLYASKEGKLILIGHGFFYKDKFLGLDEGFTDMMAMYIASKSSGFSGKKWSLNYDLQTLVCDCLIADIAERINVKNEIVYRYFQRGYILGGNGVMELIKSIYGNHGLLELGRIPSIHGEEYIEKKFSKGDLSSRIGFDQRYEEFKRGEYRLEVLS